MQVKNSQLPQSRALVNPHSGCTSISIHAARGAKDLIRAVLLFLLAFGAVLMAPAALWSQTVSFAGSQTTVAASALNQPTGVALDGAGNVFIADTQNSRVVKVPAGGGAQTTIAVSGLSSPYGVAVDGAGNVFIADPINNRVVELPAGGSQTTVGSGLYFPTGVAVDGAGNVFIADTFHNRVVELPAGGSQTTIAVSGLSSPYGVAVDGAGNIFIADFNNNRVVKVPAGCTIAACQSTVGSGLAKPQGVAVDGAGNVFIADTLQNRVVEVQLSAANLGTVNVCPSGQGSSTSCGQTLTLNYNVTADGTLGRTPTVVTQGAANLDFTLAGGSTCIGDVTAGSSCTVNVTFTPRAPGLRMGAVELADASGNLATTPVYGNGQGPAIAFDPGVQTTLPASGLFYPAGMAVDAAGNVFIADSDNNRVLKLPAGTTVGSGLDTPQGVAVDGAGNVFIADTINNRVLKVPAGGGAQTTVGNELRNPYAVTVDGAGNVFIADSFNNRVLKVPAGGGAQTTIPVSGLYAPRGVAVVLKVPAGGGSQTTVGSGLSQPFGVAVDGAGDVFIVDVGNSRVLEVPAGCTSADCQTTVGGLRFPNGVAVDGAGDVFIADAENGQVIEVQRSQPPSLSFAPTPVGSTSSDSPQSVTVENIGNGPLSLSGLTVGSNFAQTTGSGTPADCTTSSALAPGASCNLSLSFTPSSIGPITGTATLTDNSLNGSPATQSIGLMGTGNQQTQTITFNPIPTQVLGTPLSLSASASSGLTVSFASLTTAVCTVSGTTVTFATAGTCTIQASQSGNATYAAATPVSQSFSVMQKTQTITFNPIPTQVLGTPLTLSASASSGLPVSFASLTTAVCTVSGTTATLVKAGTCTIQASQSGNASYAAATPVPQSFSVSDFTLTVSPPSQIVSAGHTAVYSSALTSVNGFSGTVTLGCTGGPPNSTCTVSPVSVALSRSSSSSISVTMKAQQNVNHGTFTLTITARSGADVHTATASITVK
jgi:large repetitive protein